MKKILKKDLKSFVEESTAYLNDLVKQGKAIKVDYVLSSFKYQVQTKYGELDVIVDGNSNLLFAIFTCFGEVTNKMKNDLGLSNTGKFNFYSSHKDVCISDFKNYIESII